MKVSAYGKPILISGDQSNILLNKIDVKDEIFIQDLIFKQPECLPVSDIDESFNPLIPVCKELNTPVGPLDILMINPNGEIAIIETKLWRNPEARRTVVAQILDYAKELSNWTYEDLQREVNRKMGSNKTSLYEIAKAYNPDLVLSEPDFIDSVTRNLYRGRFLLLIAGDGIREGARGISEFLNNAAHLNFTFAQVELNIYEAGEMGLLVIPKTIVKTVEISKLIVELPKGITITGPTETSLAKNNDQIGLSPERETEKTFYSKFWEELVNELVFDDPGQPLPNPGKAQNLYVWPSSSKKIWISAYFAKSMKRVGVYIRAQNDTEGREIIKSLNDDIDAIKSELGHHDLWRWDDLGDAVIRMECEDIFEERNREKLKEFFKKNLNLFVNVFRPRLKRVIQN